MQQSGEHSEINLVDYFRVISERKWYIIVCVVVAVTLGVIYSLKAKPIYQSRADIKISPHFATTFKTDEFRMTPRNTYEYNQYSKTKIADLQSVRLADKVHATLSRHELAAVYEPEILMTMVKAQAQPETYLWSLSVEGENQKDLKPILEDYIEVFTADNLEELHTAAKEALQNRQREMDDLIREKQKLSKQLSALREESIKAHIYLNPDINEEVAIELADINKELSKAIQTEKQLDVIRKSFKASKEGSGFAIPPGSIKGLNLPAIENQKKEYLSAHTRYEGFRDKYGDQHPAMIKAKTDVESVLASMAKTIESEWQAQTEVVEILNAKRQAQYRKIKILKEKFPPFDALHDKYESVTIKIESSEAEMIELAPAAWDTANNISTVNPATDAVKVKPNLIINVILAFILGTLIGMGMAFMLEYMDRSIKTSHHFEQIYDTPVIGVIPFIKKDVPLKEAVVHYKENSVYADIFRLLRTKLLYYNQENHDLKAFMVTSPNPFEGKTLITLNLALSLQMTQKKILLVEGDLWKPKVRPVFAAVNGAVPEGQKGLSNVLEGSVKLEDAVLPFTEEKANLKVLLSGNSKHSPSEIISPERFADFVQAVKTQFDFMVLDSPPINEKADGAVMATCADGVIMVARRGHTTWESAVNAKRILNDIQANLMGGILNIANPGRFYGSYESYKNYYYYSSTK